MAEEEEKRKINFKKIALFGLGPIVLVGVGLGIGAFLFMPNQTPVEQVEELIDRGVIAGGMLPKIKGMVEAVRSGIRKAHIIDSALPHSLLLELFTSEGVGTEILK